MDEELNVLEEQPVQQEQSEEDPTGLSQFTEGYQDRMEKALGTF